MARRLIVAVAVLSVAFLGTAFAAVENIKVSGDINVQGITRDLSLGAEAGNTDAEDFVLSQIRLRFDADLTEGVSAVIRLLNEKQWGTVDSSTADDLDLDLGYIELKEFLYKPLTLIVGRQNLRYGNAMIIGDPDTNQLTLAGDATFGDLSMRKSFDAVRAILDYSPYTIDVIYAKIDENTTNIRDDETLWGVNIAYDWSSYNGITEVYTFYREGTNDAQDVENEDYVLTIGGRTQLDLNDNLTLGVEGAKQLGDYITSSATYHRDAWAAQFIADYKFLNDYNARVGVKYAWYSGEGPTPEKNEYNGWDPMYEDQTPGELANLFLAASGVQFFCIDGSIMPREDLTLGALYLYARATARIGSYGGATGTPIADNTYAIKADEKDLAHEIDAWAIYDYTEDVQINLNTAFLLPGAIFDQSNEQLAYSVRVGMSVDF